MITQPELKATSSSSPAQDTYSHWLYIAGGLAALLQLLCTIFTIVVYTTVGAEPITAKDYYTALNNNRFTAFLRMDFASLVNVLMFAITGFALYAILGKFDKVYALFGLALIFVGVALAVGTQPGGSMIYLSDRYTAATTDLERDHLLAAGEAVLASNWWNSTGGWFAGIFLQGGTVFLMFLALRNRSFSKITAYSGIVANGLDWLHVSASLFSSLVGTILLSTAGFFYFIWFPFLAWDFFRLARASGKPAQTGKVEKVTL